MTTSDYMPSVIVEIAFGAGFATPSGSRTWTDVSDYVELASGIGTTFGRADEFSIAESNSLTITLDNSDGRFTPTKTSGSYYPDVRIGCPIRVTAQRVGAGAAVDRFNGYIDGWNLSSDGPNPTVSVPATSQIARFGAQTALSAGSGTITETFAGLEGYYPLCETASPVSVAQGSLPDLATNISGLFVNPPQFAAGLGPDGPGTAVRLVKAALDYNNPLVDGAPSFPTGLLVDDDCVLDVFFVPSSSPSTSIIVYGTAVHPTAGASNQSFSLSYSVIGALTFIATNPGTLTTATVTAAIGKLDNKLHHLAGRYNGSALEIYFDGALVGSTPTTGLATFSDIKSIRLSDTSGNGADLSYLAISNDSSTIGVRAVAGISSGAAQTASDRITLCAGASGAQALDIDTTTEILDPYPTADKPLLDSMRAAEVTDGGVLFDAADGKLTYRSRTARYNTVSAFTLDASLQQVEASLGARMDRSSLTNEVTVNRTGTEEVGRAADAQSIADYGISRSAFEIQADADHCYQTAAWAVFLHGEPGVRIPNLEVDLLALPAATQDALLAATVGTHFTVTGLPVEFPASTLDFFIEGYSEQIGQESYRMILNVSPLDPAKFNVWTVEDATYGALTDNPIAY